MTVRKFCVMTEGRSGSTSLMEAIEAFDDIVLPNRNIKCPDNELLHVQWLEQYSEQYAKLCKRPIKDGNDLIQAFFELNDNGKYRYAGFKSMPNRHDDFTAFTTREDIRFITLQRRDIASTAASFLIALLKGTWRRHGETHPASWQFNPEEHGEGVKSNLAYIYDSHRRMDGIPVAIRLYYEDLCDPGYRSVELDEFFGRPIAIRDPKPPTSGAAYISNWEEFRDFVQQYWAHLAAGGAETVAPMLKLFCQFAGAPLNGSTLIMALLNAHPDALIGYRNNTLSTVNKLPGKQQLVASLTASAAGFVAGGCREQGVNYVVPGQWQGRYRNLQVAGSDTLSSAALELLLKPESIARLQQRIGVPLRILHIYRNPFNNIPALKQSGLKTIRAAAGLYFAIEQGIERIRKLVGTDTVLDLCIEQFIENPEPGLRRLCDFLGLDCGEDWLRACCDVIKPLPPPQAQKWSAEQIAAIRKAIQGFPLLQRYINDHDVPRPAPESLDTPFLADTAGQTAVLADVRPQAELPRAVAKSRARKQIAGQRIIYAWELGMDLGHIMPFMPLALALREHGHEVLFAVRDLQHAESVIGRQGFEVMQAPIWQQLPKNLKNPPLNYAEIILRYGFLNETALTGLVKAWRKLYETAGAALIIADHAPSALLAAHTLDLKRVTIGTGFCTPPLVSPTPNLRPWVNVSPKRLQTSDAIALKNANGVIASLGGEPMEMLADLFRVDEQFLCAFPELDHYHNRAQARYWGPSFNIDEGAAVAWPKGRGKTVFIYLKTAYKDYEKVLTAVAKQDVRVVAYVSGITDEVASKYRSDRLIISPQPVKLRPLLKDCSLAVCHAGAGTVAALLLHGVPLLLLPTQLEQFLMSRRVEELGAGLLVDSNRKDKKLDHHALLQRVLTESSFRKAAEAFAKKYAKYRPEEQYRAMAAVVVKMLG